MKNKEIIKELMEKYNEYRQKWIKKNKNDFGFDTWFTQQIKG